MVLIGGFFCQSAGNRCKVEDSCTPNEGFAVTLGVLESGLQFVVLESGFRRGFGNTKGAGGECPVFIRINFA